MARTATMDYREGADGVLGNADDRGFTRLAEVDGIAGVGPATISKAAAYAVAQGYASERGGYVGIYFTERQARQTLELVAEATAPELDVDASSLRSQNPPGNRSTLVSGTVGWFPT